MSRIAFLRRHAGARRPAAYALLLALWPTVAVSSPPDLGQDNTPNAPASDEHGTPRLGFSSLRAEASSDAPSPPSSTHNDPLEALIDTAIRRVGLAERSAQAADSAGTWANATERTRGDLALQGSVGLMTMGPGMGPAPMVSVGVHQDIAKRGVQRLRADAVRAEQAALLRESDAARRRLRREVETLVATAHYLRQQHEVLTDAHTLTGAIEAQVAARLPYDLSLESALLVLAQRRVTLERETLALRTTDIEVRQRAESLGVSLEHLALPVSSLWFFQTPPIVRGSERIEAPTLDADAQRRNAAIATAEAEAQATTATWSIGGSYGYSVMMAGHDATVPSHALMVDVGVRFPSSRAAKAGVAYQRDEAQRGAAAEAEARRDLVLLARSLEADVARWTAEIALLEGAESTLQSDAEQALTRALRRGGNDVIAALTVWSGALERRRARHTAEYQRAVARIALRELYATENDGALHDSTY